MSIPGFGYEYKARKRGFSTIAGLDEAVLYITTQPCSICAKMIVNAGINKIVFEGEYPDEFAVNFLKEAVCQNSRILRYCIESLPRTRYIRNL